MGRAIGINNGRIFFAHGSHSVVHGPPHQSSPSSSYPLASVLGFSLRHVKIALRRTTAEAFVYVVPIWFPLVLLLITPMRWLIAQPANKPAFPVFAKQP